MEKKDNRFLETADKLLRVGSSDDIREFLPDLIIEKNRLKSEAKALKFKADYFRDKKFIELKRDKIAGVTKFTEKDIEKICSTATKDKFWDIDLRLAIVGYYEEYIAQLSQRKIDLAVDNKNYREAGL